MLILASKSPRRKEILKELGYSFIIHPSIGEEIFDQTKPIDEALIQVSSAKAKEVFQVYPEDLIISADTIVLLDNTILGKPESKQQAIDYLTSLSNRYHEVKTGVCILSKKGMKSHVETTKVYFKDLTQSQILEYVNSGKCMDKAGAYGIQECDFVDHIEGSYSNVVGLPKDVIKRMLEEL
ncbi:MAG: septum formation protein Maf [Holdemanella sp.]|nr:septum formation protein Maf [Holdemanella sp.]